MIFLGLALWWDLRRDLRLFRKYTASNFEKVFETNFEKVFETLDPLVNETKRTSAASPRQRLSKSNFYYPLLTCCSTKTKGARTVSQRAAASPLIAPQKFSSGRMVGWHCGHWSCSWRALRPPRVVFLF